MIIDLSSIKNDDYVEEYKIKSRVIIEEISVFGFNFIIIPVGIFNILEKDDRFISEVDVNMEEPLCKVGSICELECYVDIHMRYDEILLNYDKIKMRDVKIDHILNDNELLKEKRVKIIS